MFASIFEIMTLRIILQDAELHREDENVLKFWVKKKKKKKINH